MAAKKAAAKAAAAMAKAEKDADLVMGTNNSSIVSKRSVEMSYYPKPHFFRYFVKKPQRRAPLINRGYWLRMHAMAETVRRFISEPSERPKYILNLGCGFDPLPFILLSADASSVGESVRFVDIDYEKLMVNKKTVIQKTPEITDLLKDVEFLADDSPVQIRSAQYIGIGCDLKDLKKLEDTLQAEINPARCSILCLAEVSLTYMDVTSANAVVRWAAQLSNDVQFGILEQFFPDGPDHPFASTMMNHFNKLRAPLFSIHEYPSLRDQERRFKEAGWTQARARSLWDLWSDDQFVNPSLRKTLDEVEPFDEWEEFALFASHYFLLIASTQSKGPEDGIFKDPERVEAEVEDSALLSISLLSRYQPNGARRRYGAVIFNNENAVGHHGGLGQQARLATTDLYTNASGQTSSSLSLPPRDIPARMCHTTTTLSNGDCLLVGGRASPNFVYGDCWPRQNNVWYPGHKLPMPRYRHSATAVSLDNASSQHVLIYGGKTNNGAILDTWLVYDIERGWMSVEQVGSRPQARFGACLANLNASSGILFGGIGQNGVIMRDFWAWTIGRRSDGSIFVELTDRTSDIPSATAMSKYMFRFGATTSVTSDGVFIIGGVIPEQILPHDKEILFLDTIELQNALDPGSKRSSKDIISGITVRSQAPRERPLLVGHASCPLQQEEVLILGGGAVCFSFGTFWNEGTWLLNPADATAQNMWSFVPPPAVTSSEKIPRPGLRTRGKPAGARGKLHSVLRVRVETSLDFERVVATGKPVIIEDSDIGPCTDRWTKEYLVAAVGSDRKVVVHEAQTEHMNFQHKNFTYTTKEFGTFLNEVYAGSRQYLRSISATQPAKTPANLAEDFPGLKDDFRLPEQLALVAANAHSSPLRISGAVNMWLHYDVMANVLCQVRGNRRLILYPPHDVERLRVPPGASSSTINIFDEGEEEESIKSIPHTSPHEARLQPGDVLFIPSLWLHTATSPAGEASVAVNVFFRDLATGWYAAGRDVYGNRDLQAYEKARMDVQKIVRSFEGLPRDTRRFYLVRLAEEMRERAGVGMEEEL